MIPALRYHDFTQTGWNAFKQSFVPGSVASGIAVALTRGTLQFFTLTDSRRDPLEKWKKSGTNRFF